MNKGLSVDLNIDGELVFSVFNKCHNDDEIEKFIQSVIGAITYKVKNNPEYNGDDKIYVDRQEYEKLLRHYNGNSID